LISITGSAYDRRWYAYRLAKKINVQPTVSDESRSALFGQTAATAAR
jgi:hypothetical protein